MNLFVKKSAGDSLHSLNEEEIQKKLYGTFHKSVLSRNVSLKPNVSKNVPFVRSQVVEKPVSNLVPQLKFLSRKSIKIVQSFPWKFSIVTIGLVLLSIYSFEFLSGTFQNLSKARASKLETVYNIKALEKTGRNTEKVELDQIKKTDQHVSVIHNEKPLDLPQKAFYAVQICTYQKESDAKALAKSLKASNFSSFYLHMQGFQNKTPYYVVFIGKNESYAAANEKLKEFRNSDQYQKFPDAFIRSI